jgi:ribosomal protein L7Ae-like RNA K-turn-binding protein
MDDAARRKLSSLLGLGVRGRLVVVGVDNVRAAAQRNKLFYAVVAPDASRNSLDKVVPLLNARRVRFVEVEGAEALGAAVGKNSTAVVGIVDETLARGIRALVEGAPAPRSDRGRTGTNRRQA